MNKNLLSAQEHPVKKIFCDDYLFEIPDYQRPYSWTTEHAEALVMDLQEHIEDESDNVKLINPYFLGSIVLIKKHKDKAASEVIDGQQRLTTLTILFSVLRSLIKKHDIQQGITKYLVQAGNEVEGIEDTFRIFLRQQGKDRAFFQENIQKSADIKTFIASNEKITDSQFNIRQNAKCMYDILKSESEERLIRLTQFIASGCYLVVVTTPDLDSAYRIFSVMNDRGLDLTATDILKSKIIGEIPKPERRNYTDKWVNTEDSIGRDRFSDLFSHIRMIYRKSKPQGTLVKEFHEHVKPRKNPKQFIDDQLLPYSKAYANIINANFEEKAERINAMLGWLNRIDNSDWVPPAIYYLSKHRQHPEKLLTFFTRLERLAASMMISRKNINYRIKRYSKLLTWIMGGKDVLSLGSPIHLTNKEIDTTLETLKGDVYENARTRRMILLRLDALVSDGVAKYDHKIITVEHVLPQNPEPTSQWVKEWIPDKEKRKELVHKLGNLALLSRQKNSRASNYELDKKKKEYFEVEGVSTFAITVHVLREDTWTEDVILKRQNKYIKALVEEWDLKKAS